jgi:hypothetical protein
VDIGASIAGWPPGAKLAGGRGEKSKIFLFEKKQQKTLRSAVAELTDSGF